MQNHSAPSGLSRQQFGRWTIDGDVFLRGKKQYVPCRCECGTKKSVQVASLKRGDSTSCGCLARELSKERLSKSDLSRTAEYRAWSHMIDQCYRPTCHAYHLYGAKGIGVCERWRGSVNDFVQDVGLRPSQNHKLRRKDQSKNFEPENCIWSEASTNPRKTKPQITISVGGDTRSVSEWSKATGIKDSVILRRRQAEWTPEQILGISPPPNLPIRRNRDDLTGKKFGRLTVERESDSRPYHWACTCECGQAKEISSYLLMDGKTRSCGCLRSEASSERTKTHGMREVPEYGVWNAMINRCHNPNTESFKNYGDRGISVCDRWRHSFENFIADMGLRPSQDHTIERNNNDENYCPSNCRWATRKEQSRNTRRTTFWTFRGETKAVPAWAEFLGCRPSALWQRRKLGWTIEETLSTPIGHKRQ